MTISTGNAVAAGAVQHPHNSKTTPTLPPSTPKPEPTKAEAIAWYQKQGFKVLPCCPDKPSTAGKNNRSDTKAPRRIAPNGKVYRLTPEQIADPNPAWLKHPEISLGIVPEGDQVVIDIDTKNADQHGGVAAIRDRLIESQPDLADAPRQTTPSGGEHLFCSFPGGIDGHKNWRIESDGEVLGELRGRGSFTIVSAPGYSEISGEIPTVSSFGCIHTGPKVSSGQTIEMPRLTPSDVARKAGRSLELTSVIRKASQPLLEGQWPENCDRSKEMATLAGELWGWSQLCAEAGIATDDPQALFDRACAALDYTDKGNRVLKTLDLNTVIPALQKVKGKAPCLERLEKLLKKYEPKPEAKESKQEPGKPRMFTLWTPKGPQPAKPSRVARMLADEWKDQIIFLKDSKKYYGYATQKPGVWAPMTDEEIGKMLQEELDERGMLDDYDHRYTTQVNKLLRERLLASRPDTSRELVAYRNCVVNVLTKEIKEHDPKNMTFWTLPYDYNPTVQPGPILDFLYQTQKYDESLVQLLRAYSLATLLGRSDLQKYMEIVGPGGTGKGTFMRLLIALVGKENTHTTNLNKLEKNRFECASLVDKALLVITDSDRYGGTVDVLKAITGSDSINAEAKGQQSYSYFAKIMVLIAANETLQSTDNTSGLARRRITVPFTNEVPKHERRTLLEMDNSSVFGEFVDYLPGFANWVLAMPVAEMEDLLRNHATRIAALGDTAVQTLLDSNSIAAWADENLVMVESAETKVGSNRESEASNWLYPNYVAFAKEAGNHPVSLARFSSVLQDLFQSQLKFKTVRKLRDRRGAYFVGIGLRGADTSQPRPISETANEVNPHYKAQQSGPGLKPQEQAEPQSQPGIEPEVMSRTEIVQCVAAVFRNVKDAEGWAIACHGKDEALIGKAWAMLPKSEQERITAIVSSPDPEQTELIQ